MNQMVKMAQKVQQEMARVQEEVGAQTTEATSGGGVVSATVNGRKELVGLRINPDALVPDDAEILEDMIVAAVNQGLRQAEEMMTEALAKVTGGLKLPGFPG